MNDRGLPVEFREVGFAYPVASGPRRRFRLGPVSLVLEPGEILGLIGPNASGKTTLIRLLSRVLVPDAGEIRLEGRPLAALTPAEVAARVAVVPQDLPQGFPFTVEELVLMGRFPHAPGRFFESPADRVAARAAMALAGVEDLAAASIDTLSGGERQRAMLARALAQHPRLLVLDEPTAHLDLRHQVECATLLRALNREGLGIVLVSHDLGLAAALCDRLLLLDQGCPVAIGPPEAVLEPARLEAVYGCRVDVRSRPDDGRLAVGVAWPGPGRR